ncbi:hypothetical protein [Thermofilum sp.]|uniref:hypothetical protein n=1 Tax=Thermofilum sp. TaxID=1961369 RepID=UPI003181B637
MPLFKLIRREAEREVEEIPLTQQRQDVVYINGKPHRIIGVHGNMLIVQDLATGEVKTVARP